ncbi:PGF-CTERM-anchored ABC transporter substrate-binding protein [Halovivax cerinus]|uniref:PGF-CTERM-anchored ABC transporter substrate-binding protein n=1 Tax=Halovivax cerinus TaxID=1487865 RepID=A0ABD5NS11_9EURY|nr:PGF-CTERM-anchored ABC transporter substrate-binding protein [Halovivax cerinus]
MRHRLLTLLALLVIVGTVAPGVTAAVDDPVGPTDAPPSEPVHPIQTQPSESGTACTYPLTVTDATGTSVTIDEEPGSVVAVQPSDAQLVTELGATSKLAGMPVGPYTSYLDAPANVSDVSADDGSTPVAEKVIDLDADIVLAANTVTYHDGFVEQLRNAGQTVYVYDAASSIADVRANVRLAGRLTGECAGADRTITEMNESLDVIDAAVEDRDRPLAYYSMGPNTDVTPGEGTFQHEILTRAGLENVAARANVTGWGELSNEVIVAEDPEWIVYGDSFESPPVDRALETTTAWTDDQFVVVNDNAMSQPGPLVVTVIEQIASTVHADAYAEVSENESAGSATGSETADSTGSDTSDDAAVIPGFGVAVSLLAVLSVALLSTRRS